MIVLDVGRKNLSESEDGDHTQLILKLNEDGRYVCLVCEKTFKTVRLLMSVMVLEHIQAFVADSVSIFSHRQIS